MDKAVLVAYGTKYGSTKEIAEKIGEILRESGLSVEVLPANKVETLNTFGAVVLGSAVYIGQWRKEAVRFVQTNERALIKMPVWIFSSGPTGEEDPVELLQGWRLPGKIKLAVERIAPRDIVVFHGHSDPARMSIIEKWMIKNVKAPTGDFRDWKAISAWALSIATALMDR